MNVSTLIYSVRQDRSGQPAPVASDRRRVYSAIILVAVASGPGVLLVNRLDSIAWRSFLAPALSWCLYAAVAVWYGLRALASAGHTRARARTMWREVLVVYGVGLFIMAVVDLVAQRGLSQPLVDSPRAGEPVLSVGVLMLLFVPLLAWVGWRYPAEMRRRGLSLIHPLPQLGQYVLIGLGVGLLIGFHFWLTAKTVGLALHVKPWPYMAWQFFYEAGPRSLSGELFIRGVVFNELHFGRDWNFWPAALAASGLELLPLLARPDYGTDQLAVVGVIFYTVVSGVAGAALFRWSRSVVPGYVNNVTLGFVEVLAVGH